jgi:hypothetical protein
VVSGTVYNQGEIDLDTLSHVFTSSLTMTDTDLAISNDHPAPGGTVAVSATVHNTGDLPLDQVSVAFYDGNPAASGTLFGTAMLSTTLAAGDAVTLTVPYTLPTAIAGGAHTLYAVASAADPTAQANAGATSPISPPSAPIYNWPRPASSTAPRAQPPSIRSSATSARPVRRPPRYPSTALARRVPSSPPRCRYSRRGRPSP